MQKLKSLAIAVSLLVIPALAMAVTLEGHFSGHADNGSGVGGVYNPTDSYDVYLTLDAVQANEWYPWNPTKQYTAVINTSISNYIALGGFEVINFAVGTVNVYEDDGTLADYGSLGTFVDGDNILSGLAQNMIGERPDGIFGLPFGVTGVIGFNGGTGLANLDLQCTTGLVMNDFIDDVFATNPAGFEEAYDAEWKCPDTTGVDVGSWGRVKGLYR